MFASVREPIPEVIADAFAEADRRDPARERSWFSVVDGNNAQIAAIETQAAEYGVTVPILIDIMHVTHYLWGAAEASSTPATPTPAPGPGPAGKILHGKARDVIAGIRRRATTYGYSPAERKGADECADYLQHKLPYLNYPDFLAAGRPVASGLIEGAARWLVKDRLDIAGARWSLDGAEAVLKLRALAGNGDLNDYLAFHFQQERHRNHDSRYRSSAALAA